MENFAPLGLGKLEILSLMGNSVTNLSLIKLTTKSAEDAKQKSTDEKRTVIPDINLKELNLSDNNFECFPWVAIY